MKNHLFIIPTLILFVTAFIACYKGPKEGPMQPDFSYIVINQSGLNVEIKTYYKILDNKEKTFSIRNSDSVVQRLLRDNPYEIIIGVDSALVTFSDGKKIFYKRGQPKENDLLDRKSYQIIPTASSSYSYRYILSAKDYLTAE